MCFRIDLDVSEGDVDCLPFVESAGYVNDEKGVSRWSLSFESAGRETGEGHCDRSGVFESVGAGIGLAGAVFVDWVVSLDRSGYW